MQNNDISELNFPMPAIMGILNVTPDSFYSKSRYNTVDKAIEASEKMLEEGADIIDIGGMSSRPGAEFVSLDEEKKRIVPVLKELKNRFPDTIISVDTFRSEIAEISIDNGADIINDISAGNLDRKIIDVVAKYQIPYIFMHMKGIPKNMQDNPVYDDVLGDVLKFMFRKIRELKSKGVKNIITDPGFGFGKSIDDNYRLLENLDIFKILEIPVLVGVSRKSMMYKLLKITPEESLNATSALHAIALLKGAKILRVHDVKEAKEIVTLMEKFKNHST